jgi:hypothetical protein
MLTYLGSLNALLLVLTHVFFIGRVILSRPPLIDLIFEESNSLEVNLMHV